MTERMTERLSGRIILLIIAAFFLAQPQTVSAADSPPGPDSVRKPVYERVIAHGGGSYEGYETTNSVEAVNNAISNGYKIIELDMALSSDNKIIMLHDWDRTAKTYFGVTFPKKLNQSQFLNLTVYGKLEVLTIEKLSGILEQHEDIRIVTDIKGDNVELLTAVSEHYPKLVDRFIPQIYDYDQYEKVRALGFADIIFTMYAMADPDVDKLAAFIKEHEIYAAAMPDYYAERGYCRQLSGKGVKVYIHPVSCYEDAQHFFKMGAYGVYSGSLLPEEFSGIEKDYYLAVSNPGGIEEKLTDEWIGSFGELKLHGQKPADTVLFSLDRYDGRADDSVLAELTPGKHKLTVAIIEGRTVKGTLDYFLWKEADDYRIVHKKYKYRLDAMKLEKDFHSVINGNSISDEAAEILEHSLIAKQGESSYYFNGILESYMNGKELLTVQTGSFGRLYLPLSDTLKSLGASSVSMSGSLDITIVYQNEKYMIIANTSMVRKTYTRSVALKYPVVLYRDKAMATGEFFRHITGREFIEKDGLIIILPTGASVEKNFEKQLLQAAGMLFTD